MSVKLSHSPPRAQTEAIPVFEAMLDDSPLTGMAAISFVQQPAHQQHFVLLSADTCQDLCFVEAHTQPEQQLVTGVVLIPEQRIDRQDSQGQHFQLYFSAATISQMSQRFLREQRLHATTDAHQRPLAGNYLVESWLVSDGECDKAKALGLGTLPTGAWVVTYKVRDANYWQTALASGERLGFSLEGTFRLVPKVPVATELAATTMPPWAQKLWQDIKRLLGGNDQSPPAAPSVASSLAMPQVSLAVHKPEPAAPPIETLAAELPSNATLAERIAARLAHSVE